MRNRVCALVLGIGLLCALPFGGSVAGASTRGRQDPGAIQGTYHLYYDYDSTGTYSELDVTLDLTHLGVDAHGDTIQWVASGRRITLRFRQKHQGLVASFRGRIIENGNFSSLRKPGTLTNQFDQTAVAYAVKTS